MADGPLMDLTGDSTGASIAPPGWREAAGGAAVIDLAPRRPVSPALPAANGRPATEAALRWRLRAAQIDNLIVYGAYLALCAALHWRLVSVGHLVVLSVASVLYHFVCESHGGQTLGKRRYGIQVRDVGGGPARTSGIALRSVLRTIDQLPVFYVSGLVSMVKTGPLRRQRIGDVAGRTIVVAIDGRAADRGTPGWYLPTATLAAVGVSALLAVATFNAGTSPLSAVQQAQFIEGCQVSAPGLDCACVLDQVQAHGYTSLDSLRDLFARQAQAVAGNRPGAGPAALADAIRECRTATPQSAVVAQPS